MRPDIAGWSSLVARRAHNPEVVGSNPAPATKNLQLGSRKLPSFFVYVPPGCLLDAATKTLERARENVNVATGKRQCRTFDAAMSHLFSCARFTNTKRGSAIPAAGIKQASLSASRARTRSIRSLPQPPWVAPTRFGPQGKSSRFVQIQNIWSIITFIGPLPWVPSMYACRAVGCERFGGEHVVQTEPFGGGLPFFCVGGVSCALP